MHDRRDELEPKTERERWEAEQFARQHPAYLTYRDGSGVLMRHPLTGDGDVVVGTAAECAIAIGWDRYMSRRHFVLRPVGGRWQLHDVSTNGTKVNGQAVRMHNLLPADRIDVGERVGLRFSASDAGPRTPFLRPRTGSNPLTPREQAVLQALAMHSGRGPASPTASNEEIARQLGIHVETVRSHLKHIRAKLDIEDRHALRAYADQLALWSAG
jgi:DNA-binding CsgD family transcriptional regulator